MADKNFFNEYLEKNVDEVFEIAFKNQEWRLIPFDPITDSVTMDAINIPDWVYCNSND